MYNRDYLIRASRFLNEDTEERIVADDSNIYDIVSEELEKLGDRANLNHIDVSQVTNMEDLFYESNFNGDISKWDVSNVENMNYMFQNSQFNGDISKWNISKVKEMFGMFYNSQFNQDISSWDVGNVKEMRGMFYKSQFNQDISKWNINLKILKEVPLNFDNNAVDNNNFLLLLFNSFEYKNKIKFNNLSRKVYINHIRKRLKI